MFNPCKPFSDQLAPNIAAETDIGDDDAVRQSISCILGGRYRPPNARHHHCPSMQAAGDQLAALKSYLAVVQLTFIRGAEIAVKEHWQADGLGNDLTSGEREWTRCENDSDREAGTDLKFFGRPIGHHLEELGPGRYLQWV